MPIRRFAACLGLAAALAAAQPASAAASDTRVFDVTIGGVPAGQLTLTAERNGARYAAGSTIRATGVLGALARFRYDGSSTGRLAGDGGLVPERHVSRSQSSRSDRTTEMVYQNGDPVRVSMDPPRRRPADPTRHAGTIDPVSAAYAILLDTSPGSLCNSRHELFDGHRRSQVVVGRPEANGRSIVCNGRYARLSGAALPTTDEPEWGFRLFYRMNGSNRVELERIETPTRYGLAVATPRS